MTIETINEISKDPNTINNFVSLYFFKKGSIASQGCFLNESVVSLEFKEAGDLSENVELVACDNVNMELNVNANNKKQPAVKPKKFGNALFS